jgi:hypothetical protein
MANEFPSDIAFHNADDWKPSCFVDREAGAGT